MFNTQDWCEKAKQLTWMKPFETVISGDMAKGNVRWFEGGALNVSVNCVDRHVEANPHKTAIWWIGNEPGVERQISFQQLHDAVCRFANILKSRGVTKGDRVCLYMPMIPEAAFAMLACARIGAIHSVVFAGFSADALRNRIEDAQCCCVITADGGYRGSKLINTKQAVDQAIEHCVFVHTCIVVKHADNPIAWHDARDLDYAEAVANVDAHCPPEVMASEDPLFILYTSGSTGKPKGVLHTTAGYLLYVSETYQQVFHHQADDIYWCTADIGWITGHSYIIYGPLANGVTTLMFEGVPTYPTPARYWQIIDACQVTKFYTSPTAIRTLKAQGDDWLAATSRASLEILGTVGEPIGKETWAWYDTQVGKAHCRIMDTWWQTETGGVMIAPIKGQPKPGAAMNPLYGIEAALLNDDGVIQTGEASGNLVIAQPWPGMMRSVYGDHQRFIDTYLKPFPGYYTTGDAAHRDSDGDYWITGRVDDVLNVSGHRLGTAEIESVLVAQDDVTEAAVVGFPHAIKGEGIFAFVALSDTQDNRQEIEKRLNQALRREIGPIAQVDQMLFVDALPKTRSGKIMRRLLRKIAAGERDDLGDVSTLVNPECIEALLKQMS